MLTESLPFAEGGSVVSDSLRPHGLQPTRFLHPWNFPGKSTGVGPCAGAVLSLAQTHWGREWETISVFLHLHIRRRQWHPTPVLLPGKFHRRRSLVGCSPWGRKESDTTEQYRGGFPFQVVVPGQSYSSKPFPVPGLSVGSPLPPPPCSDWRPVDL